MGLGSTDHLRSCTVLRRAAQCECLFRSDYGYYDVKVKSVLMSLLDFTDTVLLLYYYFQDNVRHLAVSL